MKGNQPLLNQLAVAFARVGYKTLLTDQTSNSVMIRIFRGAWIRS